MSAHEQHIQNRSVRERARDHGLQVVLKKNNQKWVQVEWRWSSHERADRSDGKGCALLPCRGTESKTQKYICKKDFNSHSFNHSWINLQIYFSHSCQRQAHFSWLSSTSVNAFLPNPVTLQKSTFSHTRLHILSLQTTPLMGTKCLNATYSEKARTNTFYIHTHTLVHTYALFFFNAFFFSFFFFCSPLARSRTGTHIHTHSHIFPHTCTFHNQLVLLLYITTQIPLFRKCRGMLPFHQHWLRVCVHSWFMTCSG